MKKLILISVLSIGLISCGSDKKETEKTSIKTETAQETSISNEISLKGNDEMKFDKTKFTVNAGQEVTLTFTNEGVLPLETMGHNVVVLEKTLTWRNLPMLLPKQKKRITSQICTSRTSLRKPNY